MDCSSLRSLPGELRAQIYRLVLADLVVNVKRSSPAASSKTDILTDLAITAPQRQRQRSNKDARVTVESTPSLLRTCKEIYHEAKGYRNISLSKSTFCLDLSRPFITSTAHVKAHSPRIDTVQVMWLANLLQHIVSRPQTSVIDLGALSPAQVIEPAHGDFLDHSGAYFLFESLQPGGTECFLAMRIVYMGHPEAPHCCDLLFPSRRPASAIESIEIAVQKQCRLLKDAVRDGRLSKSAQHAAYIQLLQCRGKLCTLLRTQLQEDLKHPFKRVGSRTDKFQMVPSL